MSHFGDTLARLLSDRRVGKNQQQYAAATGLGKSTISRLLAGDMPKRANLPALLNALGPNPLLQAELLHAYLIDCKEEAGAASDLVHITVGLDSDPIVNLVDAEIYKHLLAIARAIHDGHDEFIGIIKSSGELAQRERQGNLLMVAEEAPAPPKKKAPPRKRKPGPADPPIPRGSSA